MSLFLLGVSTSEFILISAADFIHQLVLIIASHAGVFRGARFPSLPTEAVCGRDETRAPIKTPAWEAILNTFYPTE